MNVIQLMVLAVLSDFDLNPTRSTHELSQEELDWFILQDYAIEKRDMALCLGGFLQHLHS